jgi:hypothetical protein
VNEMGCYPFENKRTGQKGNNNLKTEQNGKASSLSNLIQTNRNK